MHPQTFDFYPMLAWHEGHLRPYLSVTSMFETCDPTQRGRHLAANVAQGGHNRMDTVVVGFRDESWFCGRTWTGCSSWASSPSQSGSSVSISILSISWLHWCTSFCSPALPRSHSPTALVWLQPKVPLKVPRHQESQSCALGRRKTQRPGWLCTYKRPESK